MIVNPEVLKELYEEAGEDRKQRAQRYVSQKKVNIRKVIYEDASNFELKAVVNGNTDNYDVYIQVQDGEIEDVSCDCPDYQGRYAACKHILATAMEFAKNSDYVRIFTGKQVEQKNDMDMYQDYYYKKQEEKYRNFKQLLLTFYPTAKKQEEKKETKAPMHSIRIEPKLIYDSYHKTLKLECKIGDKQLYKLKNLPEFYERMLRKEEYRYGAKLNFVHTKEAFTQESIPLLEYLLKYAEIIKYANEATSEYNYYGRTIADNYITISNTGLDELFEILKEKSIVMEEEYDEKNIYFEDKEPKITFSLQEKEKGEYVLKPNIDIYRYEVLEGKDYIYFLQGDTLYRCTEQFKNTTLMLLEVFRKNFTNEITMPKQELPQLFSIVFPKVKKQMDITKLKEEDKEQYIPQDLYVKVFLDYDDHQYITADIVFIYGETEFNPLEETTPSIARDIVKEDEVLEMFRNTGFMLDTANRRLILVKEEQIYSFLSEEIEEYMKKFEILATQNFKEKEIRQPKVGALGVRIENNLLQIDFSGLDFDVAELKDIMKQYKLKKKFHRLKDGSFLSLEENETMDFLDSMTENMGVNFEQMQTGELKLPIYRSMYLERLLQNMKTTTITREQNYKTLVQKVEEKENAAPIDLPQGLQADLRSYQKVGVEWLKVLDEYGFGGILADDMGLRKNLAINYIVTTLCRSTRKSKSKHCSLSKFSCTKLGKRDEKICAKFKNNGYSWKCKRKRKTVKTNTKVSCCSYFLRFTKKR